MILSIIITAVLAAAGFAGIAIERKRENCFVFTVDVDWLLYLMAIPLVFGLTLMITTQSSGERFWTYEKPICDKEIVSIELVDDQYKCIVAENDFTEIIFIKTNDAVLGERDDYNPFIVKFEEIKYEGWFFGLGEYSTGNIRYEIYLNSGGIAELLGG